MDDYIDVPKVGAPDPEQKNSPIFDHESEDLESIDLELESGVCYFNNVAYPMGHFVCSGDEILKCCERGVWVRMGSVHVSAIR